MSARAVGSGCILLALTWPVFLALAQGPRPQAVSPPAMATVGTRRIERADYERRLAVAREQATARGSERPAEFKDLLRRQMLESMIRLNLLVLEARRQGIAPSGAEAESVLRRDPFFSPGGTFDAQRWRVTRSTEPARFQEAIQLSSDQLAARKLDERIQERFRPDDATLRERALRQLRRGITEDLSLRAADFSGAYAEPREIDVLRSYREHTEQFRRPDRAVLSVVFVNVPPRTQEEEKDPAAGAAWTARMKGAADSLLAAVRAGSTLEEASATFGGPRGEVTVLPDNFPGYWRGDARQSAAVFRVTPGSMLREPVPGRDGFLVVRVDQVQPAHAAPLAEVAREIRARLREDSRLHHDEREQRALYVTLRDSLSGPAWTFRWAAIDTGAVSVPEPSAADLDRWYRGHIADFSSFDERTGTIVARPLADVRGEARVRWKREQRVAAARAQAEELYQAWRAGRRAPALERAVGARESAPAPKGADIDTGFAAVALSDTLWQRGEPSGAGFAPWPRGTLVWQVTGRIASHTPTFEQVGPALRAALDGRRHAVEEQGARRLYEADRKRFGVGRRYHFTRLLVPTPPLDQIRLTRAEVERWHRRNIEKYSAPELVRASHVLISPINASADADRAARTLADSLLARIRNGASFSEIAARFSNDPATKDKGGDLGVFARGTMLEPFENAAFGMSEGDLAGPVKTEVGYHIIRCTEHVAPFVQPLKLVYSIVATDLARVRADTVAQHRADSLVRVVRTPAQGREAGRRLGFECTAYQWGEDEVNYNSHLNGYFERLFMLKPGQVMGVKWQSKGAGYWVTWLDSISAPGEARWEEARERAIQAYRAGAGERSMMAKAAELDSLAAAGWSLDSLGTMWGGLSRSKELSATGATTGRAALPAALDSLVFGSGGRPPALKPGDVSGWVRWQGGIARIRLARRDEPPADRVKARMDQLRRIAVERRLEEYFDDLKKRYPVRILDRGLSAIPMPEVPPED